MRRVLCEKFPTGDRCVELSEDEAVHAAQVLRLRDGDIVEALNGQGQARTVSLEVRNKGRVTIQDLGASTVKRESSEGEVVPLCLEVAVLKGDAMDWVVEKSVELGVRSLQPVVTDHTVVQMDKKGPEKFVARWQKIADQALKQCGRLQRMEIFQPIAVQELQVVKDGSRFWCHEGLRDDAVSLVEAVRAEMQAASPEFRVLIGPEGGWSEKEKVVIETLGAKAVSLGPQVLRAETAVVFSASVVAGLWRENV